MGNSTSFPAADTATTGPPPVACCRQSYRVIYGSAIAVMIINILFTPLLFALSINTPGCFIPAVVIMLTISGYIFTQSRNLGDRLNSHLNNSQLAFSILAAIFGTIGGSMELHGYGVYSSCWSYMYTLNDSMGGYYRTYLDGGSSSSHPAAWSCVVTYAYAYATGLVTYDTYMQMFTFYYGVIVTGVNFVFITLQVILLSCTCGQVWKEAIRRAGSTDLENGVRNIVVKEGAQESHNSPAHGIIQNTAQYTPAQTTPLQYMQAQALQYSPAQTTSSHMPMPPTYGQQNMMYQPVYTTSPSEPTNMPPVDAWSKSDVCKWLEQEQLETLSTTFRSNSIDGLAMSSLTQGELQQMNLPIGRVKKFLSARERLLSRKVHPTQ